MTEPLPFDIGSLGDVDSPEVVRGALRRFRRRVLRTALVVLIVVALAAGIVTAIRRDPLDFGRQVRAAEGVEPGAVYQTKGATLILAKVASIRNVSGLHLVLVLPGVPKSRELYGRIEAEPVSAGSMIDGDGPLYDMWVVGPLPDSGRFDVVFEISECSRSELREGGCSRLVVAPPGQGPPERPEYRFHVDLVALRIPERFWKTGGTR